MRFERRQGNKKKVEKGRRGRIEDRAVGEKVEGMKKTRYSQDERRSVSNC